MRIKLAYKLFGALFLPLLQKEYKKTDDALPGHNPIKTVCGVGYKLSSRVQD